MAHKMSETSPESTLKNAFSVFDKNGDGCISAHEMMRIMINLGEPISLESVKEVIRHLDANGDGMVDYNEFVNVISSTEPQGLDLR